LADKKSTERLIAFHTHSAIMGLTCLDQTMVEYSQLDASIVQTCNVQILSECLPMTIFSSRQSSTSTTSTWMRWMPFWHFLFYLSLIATTSIAVIDGLPAWPYLFQLLGFSLALGLWYAVCVVISPLFWQEHPFIIMGYLAVGWAIWFRLTALDPVYLFVLFGLYPQVFSLPPLFVKMLGAFLLTALAALQQFKIIGGLSGNLFLTLGAAAAGIIIALFIHEIVDQSQKRQRLIDELQATRSALAASERQAGIMHERQRLAHEIHDTLAQGFTSIVMHLEAAEAQIPDELSSMRSHIEQACITARENIVETRRLLLDLQPVILDHATFPEALTQLTERWAKQSGITTNISITGTSFVLRPEIEVTLLRSAQEALANVRKHSKASKVTITLSYMNATVALDVQDDGIGFDTTCLNFFSIEQPGGGFGLNALCERIKLLGGMFSVESAQTEGTTIAVALPAISHQPQLSMAETNEVPL
jgi:signal transduction histidine kinase